MMGKFKDKEYMIPERRNVGPNNEHKGPQKRTGNPVTKSGEIFGKPRKPKLSR
jgi:hypothetical protein